MRTGLALSVFCLWGAAAVAGGFTSSYTAFDLGKCHQTEKPDAYVFEGAWRCPGIKGYDIFQAGASNCAYLKTFNGFNTALSPVEWRYLDGKPVAAIERWRVTSGETGATATWLVVNALRNGTSCHMHYVAGAYPDANAAARRAADRGAESFDCEAGTPGFDCATGAPDITLEPCSALARE